MPEKTFCPLILLKVAERITQRKTSLIDILFTLFQDSQCAKATQVEIATSMLEGKTWLALTDDGEEIFAANKLALIGRRAITGTYSIELSRQLSIYHLFDQGAIIESKRLSLTLAPENFPVNRDVQMRSSNIERGTKISFPITKDEITELLRVFNCLAIFSPVAIVLNGSNFVRNKRILAQI